jgi:hypothetical protein
LIDADALRQELLYIEDIPTVTEFDIDNAPTIAAIPVEWLVSWINRHPNDLRCAWFASLEMEWRKEQETK